MTHIRDAVLVTGASGFTGRHLLAKLECCSGSQIIATSRRASLPHLPSRALHVQVDLTNAADVRHLIAAYRPGRIFHLAGTTRGTAEQIFNTNFVATLNVLSAVHLYAPDSRILCIGSAAEYGLPQDPTSPLRETTPCRPVGDYAVSKYCQTQLVMDSAATKNLRALVVRPFNLIGPGIPDSLLVGALLTRLRKSLREDTLPTITTGCLDNARDFLDVRDAVSAYVTLLDSGCWGEIFNVCSGQPIPIRNVVSTLLAFCPQPVRIHIDPSLFRRHDPPAVYGSSEKVIRHSIPFVSYALETSLRDAWTEAMETVPACV